MFVQAPHPTLASLGPPSPFGAGLSHMEIPESKPALGPIPSLLFCCPSDLPRQTADILRWICAISGRTNRNRNATRLRNIASQRPRKGPFHGHFFSNAIPLPGGGG